MFVHKQDRSFGTWLVAGSDQNVSPMSHNSRRLHFGSLEVARRSGHCFKTNLPGCRQDSVVLPFCGESCLFETDEIAFVAKMKSK